MRSPQGTSAETDPLLKVTLIRGVAVTIAGTLMAIALLRGWSITDRIEALALGVLCAGIALFGITSTAKVYRDNRLR